MARTVDEILTEYSEDYAQIDPSVDTTKGPVFDLTMRPNTNFISELEIQQDRTDRLASADFTAVADDDELERMAGAVGAGASQGDSAIGEQIFGTRSRPAAGTVIPIPQGTLVGTLDSGLVYQTTEAAEINGNFPDLYFNPTRRTYEVRVPIEAIAVGSEFNLPPFRIRKILQNITGIDFTENRKPTTGGDDPATSDELTVQAQASLQGQERGTLNGIASSILSSFSSAGSVAVITSTDFDLFRRPLTGPGADIYYSGEVLTDFEQVSDAVGGEVDILFESGPVTSVSSVTVNGLAVDYTLFMDEEASTMGSTMDVSFIRLDTALSPGDRISIIGQYDALASAISEDFAGDNALFGTDILIRRSIRSQPRIVLSARADSGFNPFTLRTSIEAQIESFFETANHGETFYPTVFEDNLRLNVIGLSSISVSVFQHSTRALTDKERIEFKNNEIGNVDFDLITLDIN